MRASVACFVVIIANSPASRQYSKKKAILIWKLAYPTVGICPWGRRCIDPRECDHLLAMLQLVLCLACAGCSPLSCTRGVACLIIKDEQLVLTLIVPAHSS